MLLEAGTSPFGVLVSWGGSVSHRGLYKPQVNGGVCSGWEGGTGPRGDLGGLGVLLPLGRFYWKFF